MNRLLKHTPLGWIPPKIALGEKKKKKLYPKGYSLCNSITEHFWNDKILEMGDRLVVARAQEWGVG